MEIWIIIALSYILSQLALRLLVRVKNRNIEKANHWEDTHYFKQTELAVQKGSLPAKFGFRFISSTLISGIASFVFVYSSAWLISTTPPSNKVNYLISGIVSLLVFIYSTMRNAFWFLVIYYSKKALEMDVTKEEKWL